MPYMIEGHNISIGASVGIALAPSEGCCADALIRNADLALYAAKSAGRGTYCFFAPEMHSEAQDRQTLEADLRKAIARGELQLQYQPVVNAQTEELSGFEALVRWHHPTRGVVSPALFIPLAEEAGLILSIGEWVLRTACLEAAKWPEHIRVAVNLSPIQFVEPSLPATVMSAPRQCRHPAAPAGAGDHRRRVPRRERRHRRHVRQAEGASACASRSTISAPAIPRSAI